MKVIFMQALSKNEGGENGDEGEEDGMADFVISEDEIRLADEFLTKFTIVSESSMNEHLDILLMLKALPNKLMETNLEDVELFHFRIFQESLIAF